MKKLPVRPRNLAIISIFVGVLSGLSAIGFYTIVELSTQFFLGSLAGHFPPMADGDLALVEFHWEWGGLPLFLIPAIGGLICGILTYKFAPEAEGHGTDAVIKAFHFNKGEIRGRVPLVKSVTSAITIGSGGSAGSEGPIAQIGAGAGSYLATKLNLSNRDRRTLLVCGMAGGMGSIFRSPLGGAIFALEVLYKRDYEVEAIAPAFISSITAYTVFETIFSAITGIPFGQNTIFGIPDMLITSGWEIVLYLLLGVIIAGVSTLFIRVFYFVHGSFKKVSLPSYLKPMLGGLAVGGIAMVVPQVLGIGYGYVQLAINGELVWQAILVIIFAKILATALSVGSGGSGGVFAPSIFIGAMVGALVGILAKVLFPAISIHPSAYILVGIAAFLAGSARTPLAAIIMVLEMSSGFTLLPALTIAAITAYWISKDETIYKAQVEARISSPAHRGDITAEALDQFSAAEAMTPAAEVTSFSPDTPLMEVIRVITETGHLGFPVIEKERYVGLITQNLVLTLPQAEIANKCAGDFMRTDITGIRPEDNLEMVLRKLDDYKIGRLPVVAPDGRLLGIITRSDVLRVHVSDCLSRTESQQ